MIVKKGQTVQLRMPPWFAFARYNEGAPVPNGAIMTIIDEPVFEDISIKILVLCSLGVTMLRLRYDELVEVE